MSRKSIAGKRGDGMAGPGDSFLAEIDQPDDPPGAQVQLVVFQRESGPSPWLISDYAGYGGKIRTVISADQFGKPLTNLAPGDAPFEQLSEFFQTLRDSGLVPPGNMWNASTSIPAKEPGAFASSLLNTFGLQASSNVNTTATFDVQDLSVGFETEFGTLTCANMSGSEFTTPSAGARMEQTNTGQIFGDLVPPGSYRSVTFHDQVGVCMWRSGKKVSVWGLLGGLYAASWT